MSTRIFLWGKFLLGFVLVAIGLNGCDGRSTSFSVEHSVDKQSVVKIQGQANYLLLPVEEATAEAKVYMEIDGVKTLPVDVRLARSKVDYYVPYELKGERNAVVYIDRVESDALCWNRLLLSDTFGVENVEEYRPTYHFSPAYGWMNAPNGMVFLDGAYHLFYQYNPYGSMWGIMQWGDAVSPDLVSWRHLPVAIAPDSLGTIFSGSSVVDEENVSGFGKNAIVVFFTSAGQRQSQSIAYSTDNGRTFTKYDKNPVVTADIPDFRDPKVFYHEPSQKWVMVVASGHEVRFFISTNLRDWDFSGSFGQGYGSHAGVWECPDLIELPVNDWPGDKKWVLLLNINPGCIFGGSATQYFTGEFDGKTFTCDSEPETVKWMDWGKDHYATVTFSNTDERKIAMAWMSNWQYANQVPTRQFRSANSIPRDLSLYTQEGETYLSSIPVPEMETLREEKNIYPAVTEQQGDYCIERLFENNQGAYEIVLTIKRKTADVFGFRLSNGKGEQVDFCYNLPEKKFAMDRTKSGLTDFSGDFPVVTYAPIVPQERYTLRLFVDKSSIECFDGDGKLAMTNLVFPREPYNSLTFYAQNGSYDVESVVVYSLKESM